MIKRKNLSLDIRDELLPYFSGITNSLYNFTTAYIWRGNDYITYDIIEDCLVLFYEFPKSALSASYPIGHGNKKNAADAVCEYLKSKGAVPTFRNISRDMADELMLFFPGRFEITPDRTTFDYVYETQKLITLGGKALHAKRNHLNYFTKTYDYKYIKMQQKDAAACKELFIKWLAQKDESIKLIESSKDATFIALDNFDALNLSGGIITINDEIAAFSVGEVLTDEMVLIHLEVASPDIRGAFNAINHDFCANEWSGFKYVNREEDMGLAGLQRAKEAYRPAFMIEKFNAAEK